MASLPPSALKPEHFSKYPAEARQLATKYVPLFRQLPLAFLPLLLREIIQYDWKFPVERRSLDRQLAYLSALSADQRQKLVAAFMALKLSPALEQMDWAGAPARFSEQLTAFLWSSRQIDPFRAAAVAFVQKLDEVLPVEPLPIPRLGIVLIGRGVNANSHPLFRKLRPEGVYFSRVDPQGGLQAILNTVRTRARAQPAPFAHWYIDGGLAEHAEPGQGRVEGALTQVSYESLSPVRAALLDRIRKIAESRSLGVEATVSFLAQIQPEELGMRGDSVLDHFQVDLLTQGSGTQVFSTTFVQWAAREALRRAQPLTLLARYAPRQRERPMNELLSGVHPTNDLDPNGTLVDADMGAYYTWLNQKRLSDSAQSSFLVWFEGRNEALAIGRGLQRGSESNEPLNLGQLLSRLA